MMPNLLKRLEIQLEHRDIFMENDELGSFVRRVNGARNGNRTRDPELGKLVLYQLSYSRSKRFWKDLSLRQVAEKRQPLEPL